MNSVSLHYAPPAKTCLICQPPCYMVSQDEYRRYTSQSVSSRYTRFLRNNAIWVCLSILKEKQLVDYSISATLQPSSDRTWNAVHGITFQKSTPCPRASDHLRKLPSQETPSQKDAWPLTESHTQQHPVLRDENREACANIVLAESPTHLLEHQLECATTSSSSNGCGLSSESAHSEDCLSSDHETFRTPLGYHIPDSKLRSAMLAEPSTAASYWHFSLYQGPGGDGDKVKVHYSRNRETTEKIAQLFLSEEVLGFDIEWKSNSTARDGILNNVSLIQIASEERVLLAHIAQYPKAAISAKEQHTDDFVAPSLKKIMYGSRCCVVLHCIPS